MTKGQKRVRTQFGSPEIKKIKQQYADMIDALEERNKKSNDPFYRTEILWAQSQLETACMYDVKAFTNDAVFKK